MITLAVFKSGSGTVKKMLHAGSLRIYTLKEVPIANREIRQMLKDWIGKWEQHCSQESFIRVNASFWNSPEGCVSVVTDYAASGSLHNLVLSVGALPENILKQLAKQVLRAVDYLHERNVTHNNICCSQVLFDRKGKVKIGPGFQHILRMKETVLSSNAHSTLAQLLCEGTENHRSRVNMLKEKFGLSLSQAEGAKAQSLAEMKKMDLFDIGVTLVIAATGGLDVISEEALNHLHLLPTACCILHAVASEKQPSPGLLVIKRILMRLSSDAQDFLCKCLQQRFSHNETKKEGRPGKPMSTQDMLTHPWLLSETQEEPKFKVSVKELLAVSSDWKDVNKKSVPADFQSQQIERIVEAIALTLPAQHMGTLSSEMTSNGGTGAMRYEDNSVRELAFDLGVDARTLKSKLQSVYSQLQDSTGQPPQFA